MRNKRIFLSPPHMGGKELKLVKEAFESNYIAPLGPMVDRFEKEFADYTGIAHCLALNSGTAAMHLALRCLGVAHGDIVIASSLTFVGSVSPILFQGATPLFIDSEPESWNMDPELLRHALADCAAKGQLPKVVVPTDIYGQCANYSQLMAVCRPYGIPMVVDAAEAAGAEYKKRAAGKGAKAAIYSFNGNKIITSSGGGMLASDDGKLIAYARKLSTQARELEPYYTHKEIGYNYRMSNIVAAIGCAQLGELDNRVAQKRAIFNKYFSALNHLDGVSFMPEPDYSVANRWLTVMLLDKKITGKTPEDIRLALEQENIESRPVWKPMHLQEVFSGATVYGGEVSESLFCEGLCLPSGTAMNESELGKIIFLINKILEK